MKQINYTELDFIFLMSLNDNEEIQVYYEGVPFFFKLSLKVNNQKLVVFSNGAIDRKKKNPPIYQRTTWINEINANCLYIDDKTIHDSILRIGWGVGTKENHYIPIYSKIVKKIVELLSIEYNNTYYFGSSAGGFMSILLASLQEGSTAIVNNPQTFVFSFNKSHIDELCEVIFPGMTRDEIVERYEERISVVKALEKADYIPKLYYFQNFDCVRDMEDMYRPFLSGIKKADIPADKFVYILYNDKKRGHTPLPMKDSVQNINSIIQN